MGPHGIAPMYSKTFGVADAGGTQSHRENRPGGIAALPV